LAVARKTSAFTLIELLVVLSLMVLLFSLVPPLLSGSLSTGALRSTAHQMAAELRQARSLAMVKQQDVVWSLDMEQRVFYTQSSNPTRFSEDINVTLTTSATDVHQGVGGIRFFPDGASGGGRVGLSALEQNYWLDVDWLTGQVQIVTD
jgi:general secretion pathway protein H